MPVLAQNKRAKFEYDILETMEAGLVLTGQEAKAAREGRMKITDAFVTFPGKSAQLTNAHIARYSHAGGLTEYDPTHGRRLLLHRGQINHLRGKSQEKGLTIIPLQVYTSNRFIKVELGIGRGRRTFDKREVLKKRDIDQEVKRRVKEL